jgi:hypothetical protein
MDPRADLDDTKELKSLPYRDLNCDLSVVQPTANRYADCVIAAISEWEYGFESCGYVYSVYEHMFR